MKKGTVYFKDGHTEEIVDIRVVDQSLIKFDTTEDKYAYAYFTAFNLDNFYRMRGPDMSGNMLFAVCLDIDYIEIDHILYPGLVDTAHMKILR